MKKKLITLALVAGLPATALARQPPALHDIQWYINNPQQREATVAWCQADETRARLFDCLNAQRAEYGALARPSANTRAIEYWVRQGKFTVGAYREGCKRMSSAPVQNVFVNPSDCPAIYAAAVQLGIK